MDGFSVEPKGLLCYINDCRKDLEFTEPTKEDEEYHNVRMVSVWWSGWPRILAVTACDIEKGQELMTHYEINWSRAIMRYSPFWRLLEDFLVVLICIYI